MPPQKLLVMPHIAGVGPEGVVAGRTVVSCEAGEVTEPVPFCAEEEEPAAVRGAEAH